MSAPRTSTRHVCALLVPVEGPVRAVVLPVDASGDVDGDGLVRAVDGVTPWVSCIAEHDVVHAGGRTRVLAYAEHDPATPPNPRMSRLLATPDDAPVRGDVVLVAVHGSDPEKAMSLPQETVEELHAQWAGVSERSVSHLLGMARTQPSAELAQIAVDEFAVHPLTLPARRVIALHPDAPPGGDRGAPGPRCGRCAHRTGNTPGAGRNRPKCQLLAGAGVASASTVASWWPACSRFEPRAGDQR